MANGDTWTVFLFGVEKPLGLHSNPGTSQGVISVTVRAVVAGC